MEIRLANISDAANLFEMNELFNGVGYSSIDMIRKSLQYNQQEVVAIAYEKDMAAGFVCAQVFWSMCYDVKYAEITELFVKGPFREKGVGRSLISFMEKTFAQQGIYDFQLFTGEDNESAQRFYEKMGYVKDRELMYRKRLKRVPLQNA